MICLCGMRKKYLFNDDKAKYKFKLNKLLMMRKKARKGPSSTYLILSWRIGSFYLFIIIKLKINRRKLKI